mmetsp:Transcript_50254/g.90290  ORF Transcript_50254/g.90290 Transcript_50254/m.90290 type:complete len:315 (+) Transcript_50254:49-993(+)
MLNIDRSSSRRPSGANINIACAAKHTCSYVHLRTAQTTMLAAAAFLAAAAMRICLFPVEDAVVLLHEDIAQDPQGAVRCWDIDAHEGKEALATRIDGVVAGLQSEGLASQGDSESWHRRELLAVHNVLLAAQDRRGTCLCSQGLDLLHGATQERSATVDDGLCRRRHDDVTAEGRLVHADLPIGLARERHIHELAGEVALVHSTKHELALLGGIRLEVEGKHRLVDELLGNHGFQGGGHVVLRDAVEAQTQEPIKLASGKGQVQRAEAHLAHLSEELARDADLPHLHSVGGEDALNWARAVLHLVLAAICLVAR